MIAFGLLLAGTGISLGQKEASTVHIQARLYLSQEGPEAGLLAAPSLVVNVGSVATFVDHTTFITPTAYDPPRIPRALSEEIMGGGKIGQAKQVRLPVHDRENVIVPPFPKDFEKRAIGLDLAFAPRFQADGSLEVQCTLNQTALRGFSNHGLPVTTEKPSGFRGKGRKTVSLEANQQWHPEILQRSKTLTFNKANFSKPIPLEKRVAGPNAQRTDPKFAARWLESDLPAMTMELTATPLPTPKPPVRAPLARPGQRTQIHLTVKTISMPLSKKEASAIGEGVPSVLTEQAFADLISEWEMRKGIDLLSSPALITRSGQAGMVEVIREFIYPIAYEPARVDNQEKPDAFPVAPVHPIKFETKHAGLVHEMTPRVLQDGSIELDIAHRTTEFLEFLNFGAPITYQQERRFGSPFPVVLTENKMEMPVFAEQEIRSSFRLPAGSTAMLGGIIREKEQQVENKVPILGDLPLLGGLGRTSKTVTSRQMIRIFVTAKLMDAS